MAGTCGAAWCPLSMRPTVALGTLAALASLLPLGIAIADEVNGFRSDQVFERRHRAEVTIDRGHATVVVRRTVENLGAQHDQVTFAKLEGKLWGKRVEHRLLPAPGEARLWAALVFGSDLLEELTEPEMMVLARRGRAVSPVTSYLAIEPGVRPSTEGLEQRSARAPEVIAGCAGLRGQPEPPRLDRQKYLEEELGRAWRECGRERRASTVVLETTVAEVVDVPAISVTGTDAVLSHCLEEAAWNLDLPPEFDQAWARWTVPLLPPANAASAEGRPVPTR
jgi:hypothetical protein